MPIGPPTARTFRILSLDGGGIRGAFTASCLAKLEHTVARPISDFFDLVTGTSTGGIIAIALGLGIPAKDICDLYQNHGAQIFTPRPSALPSWVRTACITAARVKGIVLSKSDVDALPQSRYTNVGLLALLQQTFGTKKIEDIKQCRIVIPSINLVTGLTVTFKTPHQPNFIRDRHFAAVDVALATSAAPTYFPAARFNGGVFCDGGLWANNPSVVGYAEALRIHEVCGGLEAPPFDVNDVRLLSVGTGKPRYFFEPTDSKDGLFAWGPQLFDVASGAQSQGAHFKAQYMVGKDRYHRIDFDMPDPPWFLDAIDKIPQLVHNGAEQAAKDFQAIKTTFLETIKQPPQFF